MSEDHTVSFSLEVNVKEAAIELRKLQTILYRTLDLMQKFSGKGNVSEAIARLQKMIAITNQLRLAFIALHAASGPIGWALAIIGVAGFTISTAETMRDDMTGVG
jgi:hypothetical protein